MNKLNGAAFGMTDWALRAVDMVPASADSVNASCPWQCTALGWEMRVFVTAIHTAMACQAMIVPPFDQCSA